MLELRKLPFRTAQIHLELQFFVELHTKKALQGCVHGAANDFFTLTSPVHSTSTRGHTNYFLTVTTLTCTSISSHSV